MTKKLEHNGSRERGTSTYNDGRVHKSGYLEFKVFELLLEATLLLIDFSDDLF
jgi:hypothetical protein